MKTIGFIDKVGGQLKIYNKKDGSLFRQKKNERIAEAMKELEHLGNAKIVFIKGNKIRVIAERGW